METLAAINVLSISGNANAAIVVAAPTDARRGRSRAVRLSRPWLAGSRR